MKYQSEMCKIVNCPPTNSTQDQQTAYRFVYDPMCDKSFLPQGIKEPSRVDKADENIKCSFLALSFFNSEESAKKRYNKLKKQIKNINKILGSHIAEGTLNSNDGFRTKICNRSGHFDYFEKKGINLIPNFKIVTDLR